MKKINKVDVLGIIGLGYVGLPLALQFQKYFKVVGFDVNKSRINNLKKNIDKTKEVVTKELKKVKNLRRFFESLKSRTIIKKSRI